MQWRLDSSSTEDCSSCVPRGRRELFVYMPKCMFYLCLIGVDIYLGLLYIDYVSSAVISIEGKYKYSHVGGIFLFGAGQVFPKVGKFCKQQPRRTAKKQTKITWKHLQAPLIGEYSLDSISESNCSLFQANCDNLQVNRRCRIPQVCWILCGKG